MTLKTENATYLYVGAFVDELARVGVKHVCLCPGSRSAPLALMLAGHRPPFKLWMHLDERSAAFFALGLAKAQRFPAALVCTSGTAAANFLPAVVEAHYARVPLIILTADRPHELRDSGAPQTIDQIKMYGPYAKWFVEMALPEASAEALRYARTVAGRAVSESLAAPAGPVHLNFPFREPLVPMPAEIDFEEKDRDVFEGRAEGQAYVTVTASPRVPEQSLIAALGAELSAVERGLIIAGPQTDPKFASAVSQLSEALGFPTLADPLSQVRCGPHERRNVIDGYDAFLRDSALVDQLAPEVVLRFGATPTSKPVLFYLGRQPNCRQILIDEGWNDPARLASDVIHADAKLFCEALAEYVRSNGFSFSRSAAAKAATTNWVGLWREINCRTRGAITAKIEESDELFEGRVFSELAACLPDGATLWASSSMPVRDLDTFFPSSARAIRFLSNRGANGIDGVVSSALGAGAASEGPLVLVVGDIAFYHDLNGLLAVKLHQLKATIILLNNDGGGIFSFLPQAEHPQYFEQLFGTPHGLEFQPAAALYGARFERVKDWAEFRAAVNEGLRGEGLKIVEVQTERRRNVALHRAIWPAVVEAVWESRKV
jgi:2-succinyl-5-enolpyruvyl-6-hydroxy-3-cyclohexene-1-carboxylate synthase